MKFVLLVMTLVCQTLRIATLSTQYGFSTVIMLKHRLQGCHHAEVGDIFFATNIPRRDYIGYQSVGVFVYHMRDCETEEMEIVEDHVHIFTRIPPRYSVGEMVRLLKSVSAKEILLRYPHVNRELGVENFGKMHILSGQLETK